MSSYVTNVNVTLTETIQYMDKEDPYRDAFKWIYKNKE